MTATKACANCGQLLAPTLLICPQCGTRSAGSRGGAAAIAPFDAPLPRNDLQPAGFWVRCAAFVIDLFALTPLALLAQMFVPLLAGLVIWWIYFCAFETSRWHATPGKRVMGLHVTDVNGVHLHAGRASVRFLGKIVSAAPLFAGYLFPLFTRDKQALHDLIAGTLVLKRI